MKKNIKLKNVQNKNRTKKTKEMLNTFFSRHTVSSSMANAKLVANSLNYRILLFLRKKMFIQCTCCKTIHISSQRYVLKNGESSDEDDDDDDDDNHVKLVQR